MVFISAGLTNEEFMEFLNYYNEFYSTVSEISESHTGHSLINNNFKLFSLEDMLFNTELFNNNYPKTTDALYYKYQNGKLILYLIEFKFISFMNNKKIARRLLSEYNLEYANNQYLNFNENFYNDLEMICNTYEDTTEINLLFKPIETLNILLPELYEKYCEDNNIPLKDIRAYLRNIEKKYIIFIGNNSKNKSNLRAESKNPRLWSRFEKLVRSQIIDDYKIYPNYDFKYFLEYEKLL